ncbi:MAG: glycosyltransferase [Bacteroidales bacterium]|nr:glycosyltransferase [Bacteroidales bacterium]
MKKVLVISKCATHPTIAGNSSWLLSLINSLRKYGYSIHFLYINEPAFKKKHDFSDVAIDEMTNYFGSDFSIYKMSCYEKIKSTLLYYVSLIFRNGFAGIDDSYPRGLTRCVRLLHETKKFDVCIINYYYLSRLFNYITIPKKVIATHDCFAYKQMKVSSRVVSLTASSEAKSMQRCQNILALQQEEASYFKIISPLSNVFCIYNRVDYKYTPIVNNNDILFISGDNQFNINGINWFLINVFPLLNKLELGCRLLIGGKICYQIPKSLLSDKIVLYGFIEDIESFYRLGNIVINPVYEGTGLKVKTIESLSFGKTTIVRSHSVTGIYRNGILPLFISDSPQVWVDFIVNILNNKEKHSYYKKGCEDYLDEMNSFIDNEMNRMLSI